MSSFSYPLISNWKKNHILWKKKFARCHVLSSLHTITPACISVVTNDHGYVPLLVSTSRSFPHSWVINGFVTRSTRRVPLVEQELRTLPEHMSSPPVFSGVRITRSLYLCVCFVDRCLYFLFLPLCCLFFCDLRILITPLVSSNSS